MANGKEIFLYVQMQVGVHILGQVTVGRSASQHSRKALTSASSASSAT